MPTVIPPSAIRARLRGGKYDGKFFFTTVVGFNMLTRLTGYTEIAASVFTSGAAHEITANLGLMFAITDDLVLDGGVLLGLTSSVNDINAFIGLSVRSDSGRHQSPA